LTSILSVHLKNNSIEGIILKLSNESGCNDRDVKKYSNFYDDNTLFNAIQAVNISDITFASKSGLVKIIYGRRQHNISMIQFYAKFRQEVGYYDTEMKQLFILHNILANGSPQGNGAVLTFRDPLITTFMLIVLVPLCFIYVTIVFALYIWFRNEPEVRATSVPVSVCMFMGCYLLLLFVPILKPRLTTFLCNIQLWLSGIGLSSLLIFATLFVKMVRVYIIFFKPHSFKKKLLSNPFLILYIILILLPQVFILLLWSTTDTFSIVNLEDHQVMQVRRCRSRHTGIWVSLLLLYLLLSRDTCIQIIKNKI